jgi:hypothetical protein
MTPEHFVHVHSMRLASGDEVLVARVVAPDGKVGYGFSFRLEATEARHMAEYHAGVRPSVPEVPLLKNHPWETAWRDKLQIQWALEPLFERLQWIATASESSPPPPPASSGATR